ncbi:MAG: DUF3047 domain-containing protein [Pseudomonadota bacterium]
MRLTPLPTFFARIGVLLCVSGSLLASTAVWGEGGEPVSPHWVAAFSASDTTAWKPYTFDGETQYQLADAGDGVALHAHSRGTASAYYRDLRVDLDETPVLHWRWRVDSGPRGLAEHTRDGDDYAARVYVVHKRGFLSKPYIINYVWSGSQPRGAEWPNAWLPQHSAMVAVRGTEDPHGTWFDETRDVRADFKARLGVDIDHIDVVVLMTDMDNQQGEAQAWYGDSFFSAR